MSFAPWILPPYMAHKPVNDSANGVRSVERATIPQRRIVVGIDGSEHATWALEFAIGMALAEKAEVIAVFAVAPATDVVYGGLRGQRLVLPGLDHDQRQALKREFEEKWCRPLIESGIAYQTVFEAGEPAPVIAAIAERFDAYLVVVGRRGRGGLAELTLGSVSFDLSHSCRRPVLLVSQKPPADHATPVEAAATSHR